MSTPQQPLPSGTGANHTPLPWSIMEGDLNHIWGADQKGFAVFRAMNPDHGQACADAALIVRTVNHHEELVEALRAALPQIQRFNCTDPNGETVGNPVLARIRALLTKLDGGKL